MLRIHISFIYHWPYIGNDGTIFIISEYVLLEDNIKRDLQEVGGDCGDWMERAQDRDRWRTLVSSVMNFRVP
jgi:hypothetical protein